MTLLVVCDIRIHDVLVRYIVHDLVCIVLFEC